MDVRSCARREEPAAMGWPTIVGVVLIGGTAGFLGGLFGKGGRARGRPALGLARQRGRVPAGAVVRARAAPLAQGGVRIVARGRRRVGGPGNDRPRRARARRLDGRRLVRRRLDPVLVTRCAYRAPHQRRPPGTALRRRTAPDRRRDPRALPLTPPSS